MKCLWILVVWIAVQPFAEKKTALPANSIETSVGEMSDAYLAWMRQHPGVVPKGTPLKLAMPTIDIYSPEGALLYYGGDASENAALLRTLPRNIKNVKPTALTTSVPRPSLKEAIEMFPALKEREETLLSGKRFTIFAVTYPNWDRCKEQNEAIEQLRGRITQSELRIIEVRLHK